MWQKNPLKVIRIAIAGMFLVGTLLFVYFQVRDIISGPIITVTEPQDGATATTSLITVSGTTRNAAQIYLNGTQIFTNEQGIFRETLLLPRGYSILELKAADRFKRETRREIRVVYQ